MSVDKNELIDIVSIDKDENIMLTIADHLEWDADNEHLLILQNKINAYLGAIETGELFDKYPKAVNRPICIRIVALYEPNEEGYLFLKEVKEILKAANYMFTFNLRKE